ncbi:hypothetical protein Y032_0002g923 [Ancylostoma ceylanicum]|uniref:Uncharacterized protein n=1 Tax=Ancylostoma ceylanicum TaxID=53326 RepID=A0A016W3V7_9BILA|nr:hypothetical protein Y032_0002g923 [Ancylostoma ceylanicum]
MGLTGTLLILGLVPITAALQNSEGFCGKFPEDGELKTICHRLVKWDQEARDLWPNISQLEAPTKQTVYDCTDLECLCRFMNGEWKFGAFGSDCRLKGGNVLRTSVRREYRKLSEEERIRYHKAMNEIKRNGEYDKLAKLYTTCATSPGAHGGPAFLPWHRVYLTRPPATTEK